MQRVFVLDSCKQPLMPCHPARARELLNKGKAKVYRFYPFTIILTKRKQGVRQTVELKIDPGSKKTGISLVGHFKRGLVALWGCNLSHRAEQITQSLTKRRAVRRSRRFRNTGYRKARFNNRKREKGWLAPSLRSRVDNIFHWTKKLINLAALSQIAVEKNRFDTQKLQNPEIEGIEYQQGELFSYELREYLLLKWKHTCAYCDAKDIPLQIDHILARAHGGSNRVSNLTLACHECNQKKGKKDIKKFLVRKPQRCKKILEQCKKPLKDAAAINSIRHIICKKLEYFKLPISYGTGGQTKYNRTKQKYSKDHWIDALCVSSSGEKIWIPKWLKPLEIKACGRGSRQQCRMNKYGFPRTTAKKKKRIEGFATGDMVKAVVEKGKKKGTYVGRVAVRSNGYFNITSEKTTQGISHIYCKLLQYSDGYSYS